MASGIWLTVLLLLVHENVVIMANAYKLASDTQTRNTATCTGNETVSILSAFENRVRAGL